MSRICADLDAAVEEFRQRRLDHVEFPYIFLDATYVKAHEGARVVSKAIVVATGVAADGTREVLGLAVGDSEDKAFWTAFLRSLRARGLAGVRLVISDAHEGLRASIEAVMLGASWQRCRVHFLRNVLARVPKGSAEMVAAAIRTVFAQPDAAAVADHGTRTPMANRTPWRLPAATRSSSTRPAESWLGGRRWTRRSSMARSGDQLVITKLDRLGRSLEHLISLSDRSRITARGSEAPPPRPRARAASRPSRRSEGVTALSAGSCSDVPHGPVP